MAWLSTLPVLISASVTLYIAVYVKDSPGDKSSISPSPSISLPPAAYTGEGLVPVPVNDPPFSVTNTSN